MGRRSHIKMKVLDFKIIDETDTEMVDGKRISKKTGRQIGVVSVQVRKGKHEFNVPYGIRKDEIANFSWEDFKIRVYRDAQKKIADKEFEDKALQSISDFIGVELELD